MKLLVTGGAGFIGSAVVRQALEMGMEVVNFDLLTYAGRVENLTAVADHENYAFVQDDIRNISAVEAVFSKHEPDAVMHLAAESHVDRSIDSPADFIHTNINGTYNLLHVARKYWEDKDKPESFRFHHISTDEVYGSLGDEGFFTEETAYAPNSPYSASKAASDHLARAWFETYKLPVVTTNCSNNYGPYQFPEKLIPVVILSAIAGNPIPVYGDGSNIRDWLYVEDHADALLKVLKEGVVGQTYNIGGNSEVKNIDLVRMICSILNEYLPSQLPYNEQITFVTDRPGHDFRYAIDCSKIKDELGWEPSLSLRQGMEKTVQWYLDNKSWWQPLEDISRRGL